MVLTLVPPEMVPALRVVRGLRGSLKEVSRVTRAAISLIADGCPKSTQE